MAYFDAFTANLFRTDISGRRVICPFGRRVFAVSPNDERRIKRAVKAFHATMLVVLVAGVVGLGALSVPPWLWPLLFAAFWVVLHVLGQRVLMAFLARSLTPLQVDPADLTPVTRAERFDAFARATGRRTLWALTLLSLVMTALSVWVSVVTKRNVGWFAAVFFALCMASIVSSLRHSRVPPNQPLQPTSGGRARGGSGSMGSAARG